MFKKFMLLGFIAFLSFSLTLAQTTSVNIDTVLSDYKVNDDASKCIFRYPIIATTNYGSFVITWQDERNSNRNIYAQRFDASAHASDINLKVNDDEESRDHYTPFIGMSPSGEYVITWSDERNSKLNNDIYAQRYGPLGELIGVNYIVNGLEKQKSQTTPSIAMDNDGSYVITWCGNSNNDHLNVYAQRYGTIGNALGINDIVNDDEESFWRDKPSIALNIHNGNYVIIWRDKRNGDYDIYAQRYDAFGIALSSNILINDDSGSSSYRPHIAMCDSGNFVITWTGARNRDFNILAKRFDAIGNALSGSIQINTRHNTGSHNSSCIAMNSEGDYVITWVDTRNGKPDIYAQLFDASGNALGSNFRINNTSLPHSSMAQCPSIKMVGSKIYTTWQENRISEDNYDIYCNILEFSGASAISPEHIAYTILNNNYPNPFNPRTAISYQLSTNSDVELSIFDITGKNIATLVNESKSAGYYEVIWDASRYSSGIYFYSLKAGNFVETRKMILMK